MALLSAEHFSLRGLQQIPARFGLPLSIPQSLDIDTLEDALGKIEEQSALKEDARHWRKVNHSSKFWGDLFSSAMPIVTVGTIVSSNLVPVSLAGFSILGMGAAASVLAIGGTLAVATLGAAAYFNNRANKAAEMQELAEERYNGIRSIEQDKLVAKVYAKEMVKAMDENGVRITGSRMAAIADAPAAEHSQQQETSTLQKKSWAEAIAAEQAQQTEQAILR